MIFQKNRKYQLRTQIDLSITFNLDDEVCGVGTESVYPKANGGLLYLYRRAKIGSTKIEKKICRNVPDQLGNSNEAVLKFSHPLTNVLYEIHTLTDCKARNKIQWKFSRLTVERLGPASVVKKNQGRKKTIRVHCLGNELLQEKVFGWVLKQEHWNKIERLCHGQKYTNECKGNILTNSFFIWKFP